MCINPTVSERDARHKIRNIRTLTETTIQLTHPTMTANDEQVFGIAILPAISELPCPEDLVTPIPVQRLDSTVWEECRAVGVTHLITLAAPTDNTRGQRHIIKTLIDVSRSEPTSLVFGVPDGTIPPNKTSFSQRIIRWRTDRWARLLTACPLKNVWSQYRVYPVDILEKLSSDQIGAAWMFDMMVRGAWGGVPLVEMPLSIPKPRPFAPIQRLRWKLFLRWLVILLIRPKVLLRED